MSFKITGTGSAIPKQLITNHDLSKIIDTSDEWISTRVGTKERRILNSVNETHGLITLAVEAAEKAIENAGIDKSKIDMVICSTVQGEYITPSMSPLIAKELGIEAKVMDMNMACCGFVYALDMADAYIMSGKASKILIVCAEAMSRIIDWKDRSTCVLFGDAAGAAIIEQGDNCIDIMLTANGQIENIYMPHMKCNCPYSGDDNQPSSVLYMNGQEIYKFAVKAIYNDINTILTRNNMTTDDVKYFLAHQANKRIIDSAMKKLGVPEDRYPCNIEKYGNTSSATIPLLLDEINRLGMIECGDIILMNVFGAGLTTAACLIKW